MRLSTLPGYPVAPDAFLGNIGAPLYAPGEDHEAVLKGADERQRENTNTFDTSELKVVSCERDSRRLVQPNIESSTGLSCFGTHPSDSPSMQ